MKGTHDPVPVPAPEGGIVLYTLEEGEEPLVRQHGPVLEGNPIAHLKQDDGSTVTIQAEVTGTVLTLLPHGTRVRKGGTIMQIGPKPD